MVQHIRLGSAEEIQSKRLLKTFTDIVQVVTDDANPEQRAYIVSALFAALGAFGGAHPNHMSALLNAQERLHDIANGNDSLIAAMITTSIVVRTKTWEQMYAHVTGQITVDGDGSNGGNGNGDGVDNDNGGTE
jgi:hypothetical protein